MPYSVQLSLCETGTHQKSEPNDVSTSKPLNKTCLMFATRFSVAYHKSQSINYCHRLVNMVAADNPVTILHKIFCNYHAG